MKLFLNVIFLICCINADAQCSVSINANPPSCSGLCDGSMDANVTGTPPFQYNWSTGSTSSGTQNNICEGTYYLTVTDSNGCVSSDTVDVYHPNPLILDIVVLSTPSSSGAMDGQIQVIINGGTAPYFGGIAECDSPYVAPGPQIPSIQPFDIFNVDTGDYHVIITDANGCIDSTSCINMPDVPADSCSITFNGTNVLCHGDCNGFGQVIAGGTPPFIYSWSNGDSLQVLTNLCPGTYSVTIEDSIGCIKSKVFAILEPPEISSQFVVNSSPSAPGVCDASLTPIVQGGTPPYFIGHYDCVDSVFTGIWLAIGIPYSNMCAGQHAIIVTDGNGCTDTSTCVTINDPVASLDDFSSTIGFKWNGVYLHFDQPIKNLTLYDLQGKFVMLNESEMQHVLFPDIVLPGIYIMTFESLSGELFSSRLIVSR